MPIQSQIIATTLAASHMTHNNATQYYDIIRTKRASDNKNEVAAQAIEEKIGRQPPETEGRAADIDPSRNAEGSVSQATVYQGRSGQVAQLTLQISADRLCRKDNHNVPGYFVLQPDVFA